MIRWLLFVVVTLLALPATAQDNITILALGDSLTAGYGVDPADAFPVKLEAALNAKGNRVRIINGGVSGDTSAAGRDRLVWALTGDVDAVIVELGANDALRGLKPAQTQEALEAILGELASRKIPVLLTGMLAPRNLGADYGAAYDAIFPRLAATYDVVFYPFFLDGVAMRAELNQADGIHPNAMGVDTIVNKILPSTEALLARVAAK